MHYERMFLPVNKKIRKENERNKKSQFIGTIYYLKI